MAGVLAVIPLVTPSGHIADRIIGFALGLSAAAAVQFDRWRRGRLVGSKQGGPR